MASGSDACIEAVRAASQGKLNDDEIIEVFEAVQKTQAKFIAEGKVDNLNARVTEAIEEQAKQAKIDAAIARRNAAINAIVRDRLDGQVKELRAGGLTPRNAVLALMEGTQQGIAQGRVSVYATRLGFEGRYVADMYAAMIKDVPDFAAVVKDKAFSDNVVREMFELREGGTPGITKDVRAQKAAKVFATYTEMSRRDANRLGAVIGKLDGWAGPQSHDADKMLKAGEAAWMDAILPRLDIERSFGDVDAEEATRILREVYTTIVTGVPAKPTPASRGQKVSPANLGKKLGRSRVLHFKTPDDWIGYNATFGRGSIITAMLEHQRGMAGYASQMQFFGPNPEVMLNAYVDDLRTTTARDPSIPATKRVKAAEQLRFTSGPIRQAFDIMTGAANSPGNRTAAKWGQAARATQMLAKLGGAVISSFTDSATAASAASFRGTNWGTAFGRQIATLVEGRGQDVAMHRLLIGEGADAIIGDIIRTAYAEDAPIGSIAKVTDVFFKLSGLTWWTDRMRGAAGDMIAREFGEYSGLSFDGLKPRFRHVLELHGIDAPRWDAIRAAATDVPDRGKYVYGAEIEALPDDVIRPLAAARIDAIETGLTERIAARERADKREAEWIAGRRTKFASWVSDAESRLDAAIAGNEVRTEIDKQLAERQIALLRARIEGAEVEADIVGSVRGMADQNGMREMLDIVEGGKDAEKVAERTDLLIERMTGRVLRSGERLGEKRQRARTRIADLERQIAALDKQRNKADDGFMKRIRETHAKRMAELNEFVDRAYSRAQQRADLTSQEVSNLPRVITAAIDEARSDLAIRYRSLVADETNFAVVETDARSRRTATWGAQRPGTLSGEAVRAIMQFKGFPIAFTQRVLGRAAFGGAGATKAERLMNNLPHMAGLLAGMFVLGSISMMAKDALRGWGMRDWSKGETWASAFLQSGGAGIYGDLLFGEANRFGQGAVATLSGPLVGTGENIYSLIMKAKTGDAKAADAFNVALNNTPYINLWYLRPSMDWLMLNSLREAMSPGFLRRQEQNRKQQYNQKRLYPPRVSEVAR